MVIKSFRIASFFAATNLAPLLSLRSSLVYEISAAQKLVTEWQRVFTEEKKAARITQAEAARTKSKKQRTERTSPSAAPVQERCAAIKAWPGQPGVEAAIPSRKARSSGCCATRATAGPTCGAKATAPRGFTAAEDSYHDSYPLIDLSYH